MLTAWSIQTGGNARAQLPVSLSSFCSHQDPSPWDGATHIWGGPSHLSETLLETPSQYIQRYLLGDSKSSPLDNEDDHRGAGYRLPAPVPLGEATPPGCGWEGGCSPAVFLVHLLSPSYRNDAEGTPTSRVQAERILSLPAAASHLLWLWEHRLFGGGDVKAHNPCSPPSLPTRSLNYSTGAEALRLNYHSAYHGNCPHLSFCHLSLRPQQQETC